MVGHRCPAEERNKLKNDERRIKQPSEEIVDRIDPSPSEVVADLGSGTGYITIPLARRVKMVYGIDAQQMMLDQLVEDTPEDLKEKIRVYLGELPILPLEDASLDRAVLVNVIHEIEDLSVLQDELRRCLRAKGRLSVVDFPKRETSFGPPLHERLSEEDVLRALPSFRKVKGWSFPDFYQLELELV